MRVRVELAEQEVRLTGDVDRVVAITRHGAHLPLGPGCTFAQGPDGAELAVPGGLKRAPDAVAQLLMQRDAEGIPRARAEDLEWAGRWMTDLLGGQAEVDALHQQELVLEIVGEAQDLRLPWEALFATGGHVALRGAPVGIVRRVRSAAPAAPLTISLPVRVLFVSGVAPTDPQVRAATEFLRLYRRFELIERVIHVRSLPAATRDRLRDAISDFKPDVVHIATHGRASAGVPTVELQPGAPGSPADAVGVADLIDLLRGRPDARHTPGLVVLNACDTAGAGLLDFSRSLPLAHDLVAGGIPVAVAMAGAIDDGFCRAFGQALLSALTSGRELATAVALARVEAAHGGLVAAGAFDWTRPQLFVAEGLSIPPAAWEAAADVTRKLVQKLPTPTGAPAWPVGREDVWPAWEALLAGETPIGIVLTAPVSSERRLGRTFLRNAMLRRALLHGHIPVLLPHDNAALFGPTEAGPATTVRDLARQVRASIAATTQALANPALTEPESRILMVLKAPDPVDAHALLVKMGATSDEGDVIELAPPEVQRDLLSMLAIRLDLAGLQERVKAIGWRTSRVVVLVDDVHLMDLAGLALVTAVGEAPPVAFGLGRASTPIHYVLAVGSRSGAGTTVLAERLKKLAERTTASPVRPVFALKTWVGTERDQALAELLLAESFPGAGPTEIDGLTTAPGKDTQVYGALAVALWDNTELPERAVQLEVPPELLATNWGPLRAGVAAELAAGRLLPLTDRNAQILKGGR